MEWAIGVVGIALVGYLRQRNALRTYERHPEDAAGIARIVRETWRWRTR